MAENRVVQIILQAVDKASAVLRSTADNVETFAGRAGAKLKNLGAEASSLLRNRLFQGAGLAALVAGLKESFDSAGKLQASLQKLEGTAKLTGVPLDFLQGIAARAQEQFKLSAIVSNDLAAELAKLAGKAGDVGQASPALQSFLDIGAARGLTASETLKAVQQAILGIDEGTDKLFGSNPSALYDAFAASIGSTAASLTEQQKAQALLTAATEAGTKVQGAYTDSLGSLRGVSDQMKQALTGVASTLGEALAPAFRFVGRVVQWFAEGAIKFIGEVQLLGVDLALAWDKAGAKIKGVLGGMLMAFGEFVGENRIFLFIFGDTASKLADKMADAGTRMVRQSTIKLREIAGIRKEAEEEILGRSKKFDTELTDTVKKGEKDRTTATKQGAADRKKAADELARELERLNVEIATKTLMLEQGLTKDQADEQVKRSKFTKEHIADQVSTVEAGYRRIDALNTQLAAGLGDQLRPKVVQTTSAFRELGLVAAPAATSINEQVRKLADSLQISEGEARELLFSTGKVSFAVADAARGAVGLAQGLGAVDDKMAAAANNAITFADKIGGALGGKPDAMLAAVGSLTGVLGAIFGESPETRARKELLRKNTDALLALERVQGDLLRLSTPGSTFTGAEAALQAFLASDGAESLAGSPSRRAQGQRGLVAALAAQGLTLADLDQLAEDLGIGIRNKETGRLEAGGLRGLLEAIGATEVGQFGQDFDSQLDRISRGIRIGAIAPEDELAQILGALGGRSPALVEALRGFDVGTAEGRAGAAGSLRSLFGQLNTGALGAADLGALSGSQFLGVLEQLVELLSSDRTFSAFSLPGAPSIDPLRDPFGLLAAAPDFTEVLTAPLGASVDLLGSIDSNISRLAETLTRAGGGAFRFDRFVGEINVFAGPGADGAEIASAVRTEVSRQREELFLQFERFSAERLAQVTRAGGSATVS